MAQIIWSRGHPVELLLDLHQILLDVQQDSTGCPLEFCKFASNVLELLISLRNAIKISTGHPVEFLLDVPQNLLDVQQNCSTGCPLEQKIWGITFLSYCYRKPFLNGMIYMSCLTTFGHPCIIIKQNLMCLYYYGRNIFLFYQGKCQTYFLICQSAKHVFTYQYNFTKNLTIGRLDFSFGQNQES